MSCAKQKRQKGNPIKINFFIIFENQTGDIENFIDIKGLKAQGNHLTTDKLKQVNLLEHLPYEEPEEVVPEELEVQGETEVYPTDEDLDGI